MDIIKASPSDVDDLLTVSWKTFYEAFHHLNTEANMRAYMNHAFNREKLLEELQNENSSFYFARENNQIIGYLKVNCKQAQTEFKDGNSLEVERIYVDKDFQSSGVGTLLLHTAIDLAYAAGNTYIWLGVWEKNPAAIRFYQRNGFEVFSSHEFIMGDEVQTDKLMICKLRK